MEHDETVAVDEAEMTQLAFMVIAFNALVARFGGQVTITAEEVYTHGRRRLRWERADDGDHEFSLGPPADDDE